MTYRFFDETIGEERNVTEQDIRSWVQGSYHLKNAVNEYIESRRDLEGFRAFEYQSVDYTRFIVDTDFDQFVILIDLAASLNDRLEDLKIPFSHLTSDDILNHIHEDCERKRLEAIEAERLRFEKLAVLLELQRLEKERSDRVLYERLKRQFEVDK